MPPFCFSDLFCVTLSLRAERSNPAKFWSTKVAPTSACPCHCEDERSEDAAIHNYEVYPIKSNYWITS